MSDTEAERDRGGRFVIGGKAGPGRPRGSRSKLCESFLQDVHAVWEERGIAALNECAAKKPAEFCRIVAMLMPSNLHVELGFSATNFASTFRQALAALGNEQIEPPRRALRAIDDNR